MIVTVTLIAILNKLLKEYITFRILQMSFRICCIIFVLISYLKISAILSDHETLADSNNRKIQHHPHHYSQTQNNHSAIINLEDRCRHKLIRFSNYFDEICLL